MPSKTVTEISGPQFREMLGELGNLRRSKLAQGPAMEARYGRDRFELFNEMNIFFNEEIKRGHPNDLVRGVLWERDDGKREIELRFRFWKNLRILL